MSIKIKRPDMASDFESDAPASERVNTIALKKDLKGQMPKSKRGCNC